MPARKVRRITSATRALDAKEYKRIVKETNRWLVVNWHEELRPIHFTPEGARRYRYARRRTKDVTTGQVRTFKSGRPRSPDGNPLVWSGRSRSLSRSRRVTASHKQASLTMPVRALNFKPQHNPIDMRDEFIRVTDQEHTAQERRAQVIQTRTIRRYNASKTRNIG